MTAQNRLLRQALLLDFAASAPTAVVLLSASRLLSGYSGIPDDYLLTAGLILVPWCFLVAWAVSFERAPDPLVWSIIVLNGLWSAGSVLLLFATNSRFSPTSLGVGIVLAQATTVVGFAVLQYLGLRRASPASNSGGATRTSPTAPKT